MNDIVIPFVEEGLLEYLQRLYPDTSPDLHLTDREIWMNRGCVEVIRHLKHLHTLQQENLLGDLKDVLRK